MESLAQSENPDNATKIYVYDDIFTIRFWGTWTAEFLVREILSRAGEHLCPTFRIVREGGPSVADARNGNQVHCSSLCEECDRC
jgi:hypothetical protein